ncbi:MAG: 30S ribosomal protein S12 methylthiotransferase RimO [Nitrospirae bacterium]|nr:30S ribosomal protein S12 methylthiotransferase RimO [Nitrospirota bacterium]
MWVKITKDKDKIYFYLISLGCAKNLIDSEKITEHLIKAGYALTEDISEASLIIINTCGFIKDAKRESIDVILNTLQEKPPDSKIVVYGCLVQRYQKELKELIPEVDLFLPIISYKEFTEKIMTNFPISSASKIKKQKRILFTPPSYTYIKISEGCGNFCSYCSIPLIRGPLKSYSINEIVSEVKKALDRGVYEINLIAQDITAYGVDIYQKPSLNLLIKSILSIKREFWLRLLYLYPARISTELIKLIKSDSRIVKYVDIPIQHVNNRILRLMNRHYTKEILRKKIELLREKIPSIAIRTSIITGFPTETEKDFQELIEFIKEVKFENLGVFEYSPEEGTKALFLKPRVPSYVREKRRKVLMNIQKELVKEKNKSFKGKTFPCLVELPVDKYGGLWTGRIFSQAPDVDGRVYFTNHNTGEWRKVVNVRINDFKDYDLIGECIE